MLTLNQLKAALRAAEAELLTASLARSVELLTGIKHIQQEIIRTLEN